jgi:hypothetical protein
MTKKSISNIQIITDEILRSKINLIRDLLNKDRKTVREEIERIIEDFLLSENYECNEEQFKNITLDFSSEIIRRYEEIFNDTD